MKNLFNQLHSEFNFNHKNYSFIFANGEFKENGENPQLAEALKAFTKLSQQQREKLIQEILYPNQSTQRSSEDYIPDISQYPQNEQTTDMLLTEEDATEAYNRGGMTESLKTSYEQLSKADPQMNEPDGDVIELQRRDITNYDAEYLKNFGEDTGLNKIGIKTSSKKVANDFILDLQPQNPTDKLEWTQDGKEIDTPTNITAENLLRIEREEPGDYADIYITGQTEPFRVRAVPKNQKEVSKPCKTPECKLAKENKAKRQQKVNTGMQNLEKQGYEWTTQESKQKIETFVKSSNHIPFPSTDYLERSGYIQKTSE